MFRTIANIPINENFNPANVAELLASLSAYAPLNPKFSQLSISLDDNPGTDTIDLKRSCDDGTLGAFTVFQPSKYGNHAFISMCQLSFEFWYSLMGY